MRFIVTVIAGIALLLGSSGVAEAADTVRIKKIPTKTAPYKKTVTIKPSVKKSGRVVIDRATLTVKKRGKTIAAKKKSARLKPGKYSVTQRVTYRSYSYVAARRLVLRTGQYVAADGFEGAHLAGECDILSATTDSEDSGTYRAGCAVLWTDPETYDDTSIGTVVVSGRYAYGSFYDQQGREIGIGFESNSFMVTDDIKADRNLYRTISVRRYGAQKTRTRTQILTVKSGAKPRGCATYNDFKKVNYDFSEPELYGDSKSTVARKLHGQGKRTTFSNTGDAIIEFREYKACADGAFISVGFYNGDAYDKTYWG